jgi:hypothetical protein
MRPGEGRDSSLPAAEVERAVAAFVRGLIAADYSVRTIEASLSDLRQFAAFLTRRDIDLVSRITRGDVAAFAGALADPGARAITDLPVVSWLAAPLQGNDPALCPQHCGAQAVGGSQLLALL